MLLFQRRFHEGILSGAIDRTFRLWPTARVKAGARYRCHPIGVLEVDSVDRMHVGEIGEEDARKAGFSSRSELLEFLAQMAKQPLSESVELFLIRFHHGGDGDRVSLALETHLSNEDIRATEEKLAKLDQRSSYGPWTRETLALIEQNPRIAASKLAQQLGRDTKPFKADVVKLKKLGLTQSFEVGYEISPRGRAFLDALHKKPR
jgi:hypothetical protein